MAQGVKRMDKEKLFMAYEKFIHGEINLTKVAKLAGVSAPTIKKYFEYMVEGKEFPDTLFG